jgi:hypothetical protein
MKRVGNDSLSQAPANGVMPSNGVYLTFEDIEKNVVLGDEIYACLTKVISLKNTERDNHAVGRGEADLGVRAGARYYAASGWGEDLKSGRGRRGESLGLLLTI